ncbi:uncharacterized protein LOC130135194 [Syzygium oleosum]|uniref:uncharacterized protein LOC130135194 n=1 Tax=Syzygium oleosum TaxID=219896 RepID=UPI0024B9581D|nr:uncharacterized protein LOC130135194 [Syzygium oleosum]
MTSLETSLVQSGLQPAPAAPEPLGAEHDSEPEESQAGYDLMDVDLEAPEDELEEELEDIPEDEPWYEPEYVPEYDPEFVPEDESDDEPVEEERVEVPAELGDINNPIEIEAESESSKEPTVQRDSDSEAEESDSEWTPSRGHRS